MGESLPEPARPVPGSAHATFVAARLAEAEADGRPTLARRVADLAATDPDGIAFVEPGRRTTWAEYRDRADRLAGALVAAGLERGDGVGVLLHDGADVHTAYLACERAGLVVVGIGPRAGAREIVHLLATTGAQAIVTGPEHAGLDLDATLATWRAGAPGRRCHIVLDPGPDGPRVTVDGDQPDVLGGAALADVLDGRALGAAELFLVNSTSGTTGLPKCVMHNQHRWFAFHDFAAGAGDLGPGDVFASLLPAPFGFGIWTAHVTPTLLGCPTVVLPRFDAARAIELIRAEAVTVLCCVSTQFMLLLEELERQDPTAAVGTPSLRVMFTGGEAVPFERAAAFEERTGALALQFFGSNETGALSCTTVADDRDRRLRTAGRVLPTMHVRVWDDDGADVTAAGGPGEPTCAGPATSLGYFGDAAANDHLFLGGGMRTGDVVTIDPDGYLRVVGRKSDIIIRGGKNISAPAVERDVMTHPDVTLAAAVAMPDPTFGERVCVYATVRAGADLTLDDLVAHLAAEGVSRESWPEHLVVVPVLPLSSGGKVAKGELRDDARRRSGAVAR